MVNYPDLVKKYAVKIEITKGGEDGKGGFCGSGVIVNPSRESEYAYVLTCKHIFKNVQNYHHNVLIKHIANSTEITTLKCFDSITLNVGQIYDEKDEGIVILILKKNDEENKKHLNKIDSLSILNPSFVKCVVIGYPRVNENKKIEAYHCNYEMEITDDSRSYEIRSENSLGTRTKTRGEGDAESLKGLSGSGVFTEDGGKEVGIVGIEVQSKAMENMVCIDLRTFAEEINKRLQERHFEPIKLSGFYYFKTIDINPDELDFEALKKELNNEKTKKYIEKDDDIEKFRKATERDLKILADAYLYQGIVHHQNGDNRRATLNFKKAEKHYPAHRTYFSEALNQRRLLSKKQPDEKQLNQEKEQINNILSNDFIIDEESQIELYKRLILINENAEYKTSRFDELERNYLILLRLLNEHYETNKDPLLLVQKGDLFYKLGCFYEKQKKLSLSENNFLNSLELLKDSPEKLIKIYYGLIRVLSAQKENEKYKEAKLYCSRALELLTKNTIQTINLYCCLMQIAYELKEHAEIYNYYQHAKKYLEKLNKNPELYQKRSTQIEKKWLTIKSCIVNEHISSDNELKNNIKVLKDSNRYLLKKYQSIEQLLADVKNLLKKPND